MSGGFPPFYLPVPEDEYAQVRFFLAHHVLPAAERKTVYKLAERLAEKARHQGLEGTAERLMAAYSLSSDEGRALMELAEALLRVPDVATRDALISDKIGGRDWLATDPKGFAHVAALALSVAGMVAARHAAPSSLLAGCARRLGMPTIRACVAEAMKMLGGHFVFAQTIEEATQKAKKSSHEKYSFDMLGEAARNETDAKKYYDSYLHAIQTAGRHTGVKHPCEYNGVSIKLSALYPRYETAQWRAVGAKLLPRIASLVQEAHRCNVQINIDAEESARLELSLAVIRQLIKLPELAGWEGFGVVLQAYDRRAGAVVTELISAAAAQRRRLAVRLVKGAYWDSEIKIAQEKGLCDFPLFTRKAHSDIAFFHLAKVMLASPWIYPQFATHNAITVAVVARLAVLAGRGDFEFQRLHGMGAPLYRALAEEQNHRLRVYAPVGGHHDLLAYLVRRLLENGANTSFMHQLTDSSVTIKEMAADPYVIARRIINTPANICPGAKLFDGVRRNSRGWDLDSPVTRRNLQAAVVPHLSVVPRPPSRLREVDGAFQYLAANAKLWAAHPAPARACILEKFADRLEAEAPRFFAMLIAEAGKTIADCVAEVREAVDFCRYYAVAARALPADAQPRGVVLAISPWNFPLAIFCGQITAALAAGNVVLAKPAEQTPHIAFAAVAMLRQAGLPQYALQIVHGAGETLGAHATAAGAADMAVFTGSTQTAKHIENSLAQSAKPCAPLLAETGGLNAMLVDSTALLERAVDDIIRSAFRSAGQRCSALRMLYVQEEIGESLLAMLRGAAELQTVGAAEDFATDIGPVIDAQAQQTINNYVEQARLSGRLWWRGAAPAQGCYVPPAIIKVRGIGELPGEIFGPVLHAAFYPAGGEDEIINNINATGYGLTFCVHSKIAHVFDRCAARINAGNVYINRDQIGAVVGSQPFGGCGLSGTGPKAGGPAYIFAFTKNVAPLHTVAGTAQALPGPEGERNTYRVAGRGHVLCVAPDAAQASRLAGIARAAGNHVTTAEALPEDINAYDAVMAAPALDDKIAECRLAAVKIIPFIRMAGDYAWLFREKHICRDMTASGGNAELLARLDENLHEA